MQTGGTDFGVEPRRQNGECGQRVGATTTLVTASGSTGCPLHNAAWRKQARALLSGRSPAGKPAQCWRVSTRIVAHISVFTTALRERRGEGPSMQGGRKDLASRRSQGLGLVESAADPEDRQSASPSDLLKHRVHVDEAERRTRGAGAVADRATGNRRNIGHPHGRRPPGIMGICRTNPKHLATRKSREAPRRRLRPQHPLHPRSGPGGAILSHFWSCGQSPCWHTPIRSATA